MSQEQYADSTKKQDENNEANLKKHLSASIVGKWQRIQLIFLFCHSTVIACFHWRWRQFPINRLAE